MLSHKAVWRGIDMLAQTNQLTASGLAKRAGLDPTTFNKSKRVTKQGKPRWPSTESLSKILEATQTPMAEFVGLLGEGERSDSLGNRRLRCASLSSAERAGAFDASGFPEGGSWEEIELGALADEAAYALELDREIAPPLLRHGDIVVVAPSSSVRRGDRVVAKRRSGALEFGVYLRRNAQRLTLDALGGGELTLEVGDLAWQARIVAVCANQ
jgi:phage repressor protein C with HTH and peptisase S24 domain